MTDAAEIVLPSGPMRNQEADHAAWDDAITFLSAKMGA